MHNSCDGLIRRRHEVVKQTSELSQEREDRTKELQFLRHRIEEESRQRAVCPKVLLSVAEFATSSKNLLTKFGPFSAVSVPTFTSKESTK